MSPPSEASISRRRTTNKPVDDWSRAGARNIAGVTYQVSVTTYLWVEARAGHLPVARVTPEGTDDIDCQTLDGGTIFIQAKERGGGRGTLGAADVATILAAGLSGRRHRGSLAIVTNALLPAGLRFTGWDAAVEQSEDGRLEQHLRRAHRAKDPTDLLGRSHLIRIPWSVERLAIPHIAATFQIPRGVAALVFARLLFRVGQVAAAQRHRSMEDALWLAPGEIDVVVQRVLELVDPAALDAAVRLGIAEPIDFTDASPATELQFLAGVDVHPGHIAANLDIVRPHESASIEQSLEGAGYALLVGPSGAGKSCLLWRSAAELDGRCRTIRVRQLRPKDLPTLLRWIRLLEPTTDSPVLICADDLGTEAMAGWEAAVRQLREVSGVLLLGAARWEHFVPSLAIGPVGIVEPRLDAALAEEIGATLRRRGVTTYLDPVEAFSKSGGLLMEYLSLLVAGRRLEQVIAAQVHERLSPDRVTEREIMRLTSTSHVAGVTVPASTLPGLLNRPDDLQQALYALNREHLVSLEDGNLWSGLHVSRSAVVDRELHAVPPPRRAGTLIRLLPNVQREHRRVLLRHIAVRHPADLADAGRAAANLLATLPEAVEVASLLESVVAADASAHAAACLVAIRGGVGDTVDPEQLLTMAYASRFLGVDFPPDILDIRAEAALLPDPANAARRQIQGKLTSARLCGLLSANSTATAVRLTEAARDLLLLEPEDARTIWERASHHDFQESGRLLAALHRLLPEDAPLQEVFGRPEARLDQLLSMHPAALGGALEYQETKGLTASASVIMPEDDRWNDQAVACARALLDWIPEAAGTDVQTVQLDLKPVVESDGYEPHRKTIPRSNLPPLAETQRNQAFFGAVTQLAEAQSWTRRLRDQAVIAAGLLALMGDVPVRVMKRTDTKRHRREWRSNLMEVQVAAVRLEAPPGLSETEGRDGGKQVLTDIVGALLQLDEALDQSVASLRAVGSRMRAAIPRLAAARGDGWPRLMTVGDPMPERLDHELELASDLLLGIADSGTWPKLSGPSPDGWRTTASDYTERLRRKKFEEEEALLRRAFEPEVVGIHRVPWPNPSSAHLVTDRWLVDSQGPVERVGEALQKLAHQQNHVLAFRVFALGGCEGPSRWARMLMLGAPTVFPVPIDDALLLGAAAELSTPRPAPEWVPCQRVLARLVDASRRSIIDGARTARSRAAIHGREVENALRDAEEVLEELGGGPRQTTEALVAWCRNPSNLLSLGPHLTAAARGEVIEDAPDVLRAFLATLSRARLDVRGSPGQVVPCSAPTTTVAAEFDS